LDEVLQGPAIDERSHGDVPIEELWSMFVRE
jgi:hypothetical protein